MSAAAPETNCGTIKDCLVTSEPQEKWCDTVNAFFDKAAVI